jgi:hypothetical protein
VIGVSAEIGAEIFGWNYPTEGCISLDCETTEDCCSERLVDDLDTSDDVVFS